MSETPITERTAVQLDARERAASFKARFEGLQREFGQRISAQTLETVEDHCEFTWAMVQELDGGHHSQGHPMC